MRSSLNSMDLILKGCRQNVWKSLFHLELDQESFYICAYEVVSRIQFFAE